MGDERVERRLAAILAADVVGYSRLVGMDEEGTLAALKALRKSLIDPKVTEHRGRIVKNTGDGALVEFASAVDAVRCAVEIQRAMAERYVDTPKDRRIEFRIGVNLGDIVIEEGDIFGDGVNIAVRLESIADPGGVCVSEDVYRQVRGKLDAAFEDRGEQQLKNIVQPVRAYRMRPVGTPAGASSSAPSSSLPLPDKPSIAVLTFNNMSGDAEQEYFADGIAEDIITALSKSRWLFVIARNSSFTYRGRSIDVKQIGRELGCAMSLRVACANPAIALASPLSLSRQRRARTCGPSAMTAIWPIYLRFRTKSPGASPMRLNRRWRKPSSSGLAASFLTAWMPGRLIIAASGIF